MNTILVGILIQAACYGAAMVIPIFLISFLMRDFFFKFFKVKASMGKKVMVKIRTSLIDYFAIGEFKDGQLYFKSHKDKKIINVPADAKVFYRSLGINWVDLNETDNSLSSNDYAAIGGFDAQKFSDLYERALMKPAIVPTQEKI